MRSHWPVYVTWAEARRFVSCSLIWNTLPNEFATSIPNAPHHYQKDTPTNHSRMDDRDSKTAQFFCFLFFLLFLVYLLLITNVSCIQGSPVTWPGSVRTPWREDALWRDCPTSSSRRCASARTRTTATVLHPPSSPTPAWPSCCFHCLACS